MNVLLISVVFPYPADAGGSSGMHKLLEGLRHTNDITLICPKSSVENMLALKELWPNIELRTFELPINAVNNFSLKNILKSFRNTTKPTKAQIFRQAMVLQTTDLVNFYFNDLLEIITKVCTQKTFDIAQVEFIELAPVINFLPEKLKKIFVHHEIRHRRMSLELGTLGNIEKADIWKIENTKLLEISLLNKYDKVICLTNQDKKYLEQDGVTADKLEVSSLPALFTDHDINTKYKFNNRLVFLGPEVHFPNLDAIDWFLNNCWEAILSNKPGLKLDIVGRWSPKAIKMYGKFKNVTFKGYLPDLGQVMSGAIMIVPLRIGSGMRMKILEGVSWHVPVISSSIGAEGLPMHHGENCYIADTATEFIDNVKELINNEALQKQFIEKSRTLIAGGFSVEECTAKRNEIFKRTIKI